MTFVVKNNAESTVADSPLAQAAVTLNVAAGEGANFPSTFPFLITLWDEETYPDPTDDSEMEIVKCTARTTDAMTIVRAQEGTADVAHANGERVAMLITAGIINELIADVVEDTTPQLGGTLDTNSKQIRESKGADVASASALPVIADGNYFDVTGTNAITSINTLGVGTVVTLHFDAILTLTHHATDLILPGGANITTAAGDEAIFREYATGDWRCVSYTKASGAAIVGGGEDYDSILAIVRQMHPNISVLAAMDEFDSYSETNYNYDEYVYSTQPMTGQAFANVSARNLRSVKFYLKKSGSPTGNVVARLYACTGTPGTDGTGTGGVLVTSTTSLDVSTLTNSHQLIEFNFPIYELSASTNYVVVLYYAGGDGGNLVRMGADNSSPTHAGNRVAYFEAWAFSASMDVCFYLYTSDIVKSGTDYILHSTKTTGNIMSDATAANSAVLSFFTHLKGKFDNGGSTHANPVQAEIYGDGDAYAAALNATTKFKIDPADPRIELYRIDDSVVAKSNAQENWTLDDNGTTGAFASKTTSTHETILGEEIGCASVVMVEKSVNGGFTDTELLVEDDDYTVDYSTRTATKIILTASEAADIVISQSKLRITWIADVEDIEGTANTALKMKIYLSRTNTGETSPEIQKIDLGTDKYAEMKYMCG